MRCEDCLKPFKEAYPKKFKPEKDAFSKIRRGDCIFIATACGEPRYLVNALVDYVASNPTAVFDAEVMHVWTLGVAPYTDAKFQHNFRHNSFFIAENTRRAVNEGLADYTPVFLSHVPNLFRSGEAHVDVALIQTSPPDRSGHMSLGVSVDITKTAAQCARVVIAQVNEHMPRVLGDAFIHIKDVDFIITHDEPILEFKDEVSSSIAERVGEHVSRIVEDGDTIQVGYGSLPNAILDKLSDKKDLGVHTELLSDGIVALMKKGVITNSRKSLDPGKTVATFCMGAKETYDFIDDNPQVEFRPIDYTNNPLVIAQQKHMTAINSSLQVDLTGQASAESLGKLFYSGIGGQADFMRGAVLAPGGKTILALASTAEDHEVSRIVPFLSEGAGATLTRGDIQYVVTEYGIAYIHGKNIRERAMALIAIAHPKFRSWLIEEAKRLHLIYEDQAFIPGEKGEYPEELETYRTTNKGLELVLRPVKLDDEPLLKDFFYSLSDSTLYKRFISARKDMPHERLQDFVVVDYTEKMVVLATLETETEKDEVVVGMGEYAVDKDVLTAEVAFVVHDDYQGRGIGAELLRYLTYIAKRRGLHGFTADVLMENQAMVHLFERVGFEVEKRWESGLYHLRMHF